MTKQMIQDKQKLVDSLDKYNLLATPLEQNYLYLCVCSRTVLVRTIFCRGRKVHLVSYLFIIVSHTPYKHSAPAKVCHRYSIQTDYLGWLIYLCLSKLKVVKLILNIKTNNNACREKSTYGLGESVDHLKKTYIFMF